MPWNSILGHDRAVARLRAAIAADRLHPAMLFEGPVGVGKRLVALTLAQALHCPKTRENDPCGECQSCRAIAGSFEPALTIENQSAHPGVRVVTPSRPDEREVSFGASSARGEVRSQITVSQVRVVLSEAQFRARGAGRRIVVFDPADGMGDGAANALLKTLEEPRKGEHFVLLTARPSALLPTILSRCVRLRFALLNAGSLRRALEERGLRRDRAEIDLVVSLAGGRIGRALELLDGPSLRGYLDTRAHFLECFEALARALPGGTFAVLGAAPFAGREREEFLAALDVLEVLLRDLAVVGVHQGARPVNLDIESRLAPLAATLGARAVGALSVLEAVRDDFRVNVNTRLSLERILLEVAGT